MPGPLPGYHGAYQQAGIPDWLQRLYAKIGAQAEANAEVSPEDVYQGNLVPNIPPEILQAQQMAQQMKGSYAPHVRRARGIAENAANTNFPQMAQQYMNPYQQQVLDRIALEGNRNFRENIMPTLEGQFVALGQPGSSMHADLGRRAARDVQNEIMGQQAKYLSQGYNQAAQTYGADMAKMLEAAKELSAIGAYERASGGADIQQLEKMGAYNQAQEHARLQAELQKFQAQEANQRNKLADMSAIVSGIPLQPHEFKLQQAQNPPRMNTAGDVADLMKNLAGTLFSTGHKRGGHVIRRKAKVTSLREFVERKAR